MKYLYRATFTDGTTFQQPADDSSALKPGEKSSKYDFLEHCKGRELDTFTLEGEGLQCSVSHRGGGFAVDGRPVRPGDHLPDGLGWVEGDPHQGVYFRRVTIEFNGDRSERSRSIIYCFGVKAQPGVKNFLGVV